MRAWMTSKEGRFSSACCAVAELFSVRSTNGDICIPFDVCCVPPLCVCDMTCHSLCAISCCCPSLMIRTIVPSPFEITVMIIVLLFSNLPLLACYCVAFVYLASVARMYRCWKVLFVASIHRQAIPTRS